MKLVIICTPCRKLYIYTECNVNKMYYTKLMIDCTTFNLCSPNVKPIIVNLTSTPLITSIAEFSQLMKRRGVTDIFCFCDLKYDPTVLKDYGITFHHIYFPDGSHPTGQILKKFNLVIESILEINKFPKIGIHCTAGIGRAPTMLAYLMITRYRWNCVDCISKIRQKRKHAINQKQLNWILQSNIKPIKEMKTCVIL